MRLTLKIALVILLGIALLLLVHSYQSVRRESALLKANLSREARLVGQVLRSMTAEIWKHQGEKAARAFLQRAGALVSDQQLRWVWLDAEPPSADAPRVAGDELAAVRDGKIQAVIAETEAGRDFLFTYLPLRTPDGRLGALEVGESLAQMHGYVRETMTRSALLLVAMLVSSLLLIALVGSFWVSRPVRRLAQQAERMAAGDFSGDLDLKGRDEIAVLAGALDRMRGQLADARAADRARLESLEKLRHTERLATIGRLAAGMAHELGTPLNVVAGRAKLIAGNQLSAEDTARSARIIGEQAERMTAIMRQLLDFARRGSSRRDPVDLQKLATSVFELLGSNADRQGVTLELAADGPAPEVVGDAAQLQQVLMNLVMNGLQAMPGGGVLKVRLDRCETATPPEAAEQAGPWALLEVCDSGTGIPAENLPHLFDPFFTTKEVGQGTGLGLAIAYGIVREHGGWIDVDSEPGAGSTFRVWLPLQAPAKEESDG
jgi:signal transduction histidine kinase